MRLAWFASLSLVITACSNPTSDVDVDAPPGAQSDSGGKPIDAGVDALVGNACPTSATEIARITGASIFSGTAGPAYATSPTSAFYTVDADGDGDRDLLLFESTSASYIYKVRLFRFAAGGFSAAVSSIITLPAYGAELDRIADVDGDQRKDLVLGYTTEYPRTPYVYVARQASDGTFALQASRIDMSACGYSSDQRLEAIAIYDLDRDGKDDVLATVSFGGLGSSPAGLAVAKGTSTGLAAATCIASDTVSTPGIPFELGLAKTLSAGDFDGDGKQDLVATYYQNATAKMQLFRSTAASQLQPVPGIQYPPGGRLHVDRVASRAKDGLLGVRVQPTNTEITRYAIDAQSGIGTPVKVADLPAGAEYTSLYGFAIGDFNGDAQTDVLVIPDWRYQTGPSPLELACDRGGTWETAHITLPPYTSILRAIDYDGDAASELVARIGSDVVFFDLQ